MVKPRRIIWIWTIVCCAVIAAAARPLASEAPQVAASGSMIAWVDLMPSFPAPDDRIYALIDVDFTNLSADPLRIEIGTVAVQRTEDQATFFVFRVEPPTGWNGILDPGESGGGEWRKTDLLSFGTFECNTDVFAVLHVALRSTDDDDEEADEDDDEDDDEQVVHVITAPTTLNCVF